MLNFIGVHITVCIGFTYLFPGVPFPVWDRGQTFVWLYRSLIFLNLRVGAEELDDPVRFSEDVKRSAATANFLPSAALSGLHLFIVFPHVFDTIMTSVTIDVSVTLRPSSGELVFGA